MLHHDGSRHASLEGQPPLDLIMTQRGRSRARPRPSVREDVLGTLGLQRSLYTDRGAYYFLGEIDRGHPT
jgi:hypothetical protein